jgi:LysM repeat protein
VSEPPESTLDQRLREARIRQLEAERRLWLAGLLVVICLAALDRVGQRVWAIAVKDESQSSFVERAYLPQKAQADEVLETIKEHARLRHPFYKDAPLDFEEARPDFKQKVVVRRVRRVVALPSEPAGPPDLPVARAVNSLEKVLTVEVRAVSLWDVEKNRSLVVLPTEGMVDEAKETRLGNVTKQVEADLKPPKNFLLQPPSFLQQVNTRTVNWPVAQVLTVQQAVEQLTRGEAPAMHLVQAGETASAISTKYKAKVDDLRAWNPGRDLTSLEAGQQLVVRRPEPPLTVLTIERRIADGVEYEIRRHDGQKKATSLVEKPAGG